MIYFANIKGKYTNKMYNSIANLGAKVVYTSILLPLMLIEASTDIINKIGKLNFVNSVREGEKACLKSINVRPTMDFSLLFPYSNYANTTVAVIDSGINKNIGINVIKSVDFSGTNLNLNSVPHGSAVAQIINQAAPGVKIINLKVTDVHDNIPEENIIFALEQAYKDKVKIINLSLGIERRCKSDCDLCLLVEKLVKSGILVVTAAGNEGPKFGTINCPGNSLSSLTVGAVNLNQKICQTSSRGRYKQGKPDLLTSGYISVDNKDLFHGTSFATPVITGIAACIYGKYGEDPIAVKKLIKSCAVDIGLEENEQGDGMFSMIKLLGVLNNGKVVSSN